MENWEPSQSGNYFPHLVPSYYDQAKLVTVPVYAGYYLEQALLRMIHINIGIYQETKCSSPSRSLPGTSLRLPPQRLYYCAISHLKFFM